jgi:acyl-CoA-dependent ceramide synthase
MAFSSHMGGLSKHLAPFFSLSYPVDTPAVVDSFPDSAYYNIGPADACLVVTLIAVFAILRDILRLHVFEPFASWVLTKELEQKKQRASNAKVNGNGIQNGNGHVPDVAQSARTTQRKLQHSVLRFAEQGWSAVYYPLQFAFGVVGHC